MLKIALVNPRQFGAFPQPPMALALLAAVLEKAGYPVSVVDANVLKLKPPDIPRLVDADVVGLTAMTPTIDSALDIARHLRQAKPALKIVLGGPHATLLPEQTLAAAPEIDVVARGEGEQTIIELLQAFEGRQTLENVRGISFRRDGQVYATPDRPANTDLDSLPFLAYHLLPWQKYRPHPPHGRALPFSVIVTSRGCPYRCSYCSKSVFGSIFRAQSPARVVDEIAYYKDRFGIKELAFYDDSFTLNKKRASAIADELLRRRLKLCWTCETRVNLVDRDLLHRMKEAGCYAIAYGIESGSQEILDRLHKDITLAQAETAVSLTREAGMQTIGYFMVGSPGETPETISQTIEFAKRLKLDFAQFGVTIPLPGSELYQIFLKDTGTEVRWDSFSYIKTGAQATPVFETSQLNREELRRRVSRAYKQFYLRPGYLLRRVRSMTGIGDLIVNMKGFMMLLGNIGLQKGKL